MKSFKAFLAGLLAWVGYPALALALSGAPALAGGTDEVTASSFSADQRNHFFAKMLKSRRYHLKLEDFAQKFQLAEGDSLTFDFAQDDPADLPMNTLGETANPANTPWTMTHVTDTAAEYGVIFTITQRANFTVRHPIYQRAIGQVDSVMRRLRDQLIQIELQGANVLYPTVASRGSLAATHTISDTVIGTARARIDDAGADKFNEMGMVGLCDAFVSEDIMAQSGWTGAFQYTNEAIKAAAVGRYKGVNWFEGNMLARYTRLAAVTTATTSNDGGSLTASTTYYLKVTRINSKRGLEEEITTEQTRATQAGTGHTISVTLPAASGDAKWYHIYIGTVSGTTYRVAASNMTNTALAVPFTANQTVKIATAPSSGTTSPATPAAGVTVHRSFVFGKDWYGCVKFDRISVRPFLTPRQQVYSVDPGGRFRQAGAFMYFKAKLLNTSYGFAIESGSAFAVS